MSNHKIFFFTAVLACFALIAMARPNPPQPMENAHPESVALLVTLTARPGQEQALKDFLIGGRAIVVDEPGTQSWYAFQIDERTFGIYDTFADEAGRQAHLSGGVAKALMANAEALLEDFDAATAIRPITILAVK